MQHAQFVLDDYEHSLYIPQFPILYDANNDFTEKKLNVNPEHIKFMEPIKLRYPKFSVKITDNELIYFLLEKALEHEIAELGLEFMLGAHPRSKWLRVLHINDRTGNPIYRATIDTTYYGRGTPSLITTIGGRYSRPIAVPLAATNCIHRCIAPHLYGYQYHYLTAEDEEEFQAELWPNDLCQTIVDYYGRLRNLSYEEYMNVGARIRLIDKYFELDSRYYISQFEDINHFVLTELGKGLDFAFQNQPTNRLHVIYYENNKLRIDEPLRTDDKRSTRRRYEIIMDEIEPEPEEPDLDEEFFDNLHIDRDAPDFLDIISKNNEEENVYG